MSLPVQSVLAIAATVCVFRLAVELHRRAGRPALLHPALTSILAMAGGLQALGIDHADYFAAAWPLHAALTPVVVLLAVPLCRQRALILAAPGRLAAIVALGSGAALVLTAGLAALALASPEIVRTLLARSVTTPVAIGIVESVGGRPDLVAAIVIATGIVGACLGPWVCRTLRIEDPRAVGLALGTASHVIGTARAFQISETAGAYATVGLVFNAILTSAAVALAVALTDPAGACHGATVCESDPVRPGVAVVPIATLSCAGRERVRRPVASSVTATRASGSGGNGGRPSVAHRSGTPMGGRQSPGGATDRRRGPAGDRWERFCSMLDRIPKGRRHTVIRHATEKG